MDLISIIVPIYNVEKYLKKCLESIINQNYENIEIILVDDGSTDESGKIADAYQKIDHRIKVFHKKNGGLSDSRNFGLSKSKGKYVSFIDSDDYVAQDFIKTLYDNMLKYNVKISACSFIHIYEDGTTKHVMKKNILEKYNTTEALIYLNTMGYFNASCCNKLFEKELFTNLKFPTGKISEDLFVIYKLIILAGGLLFDSKEKYYYRQRKGSITKNALINYNVIDAAKEQIDYLKERKLNDILPFAYQTLLFSYIGVYNTLLCKNELTKKNLIKNELKKIRKKFTKQNLSLTRKIQIFMFYRFNRLYEFLFVKYNDYRNKKIN